jgi:hypothetical protein
MKPNPKVQVDHQDEARIMTVQVATVAPNMMIIVGEVEEELGSTMILIAGLVEGGIQGKRTTEDGKNQVMTTVSRLAVATMIIHKAVITDEDMGDTLMVRAMIDMVTATRVCFFLFSFHAFFMID